MLVTDLVFVVVVVVVVVVIVVVVDVAVVVGLMLFLLFCSGFVMIAINRLPCSSSLQTDQHCCVRNCETAFYLCFW